MVMGANRRFGSRRSEAEFQRLGAEAEDTKDEIKKKIEKSLTGAYAIKVGDGNSETRKALHGLLVLDLKWTCITRYPFAKDGASDCIDEARHVGQDLPGLYMEAIESIERISGKKDLLRRSYCSLLNAQKLSRYASPVNAEHISAAMSAQYKISRDLLLEFAAPGSTYLSAKIRGATRMRTPT
jgi:hypothetical protein